MILKQMLRVLLLVSFLSSTYTIAYAQGWEKKYSADKPMQPSSLYQLRDYSYFMSGTSFGNTKKLRLYKIAETGGVIWAKDYDSLSNTSYACAAQHGGYAMIAYAQYDNRPSIGPATTRALIRVDSLGNKLWLRFIPSFATPLGNGGIGNSGIDTTSDGGIIYGFTSYDSAGTVPRKIITKVDGSGNTVWSHSYFDPDTAKYIGNIKNTNDGGFLVIMPENSITGTNRIFKIDSAGTMLWQFLLPYASGNINASMARDGNILVYGGYSLNNNPFTPASYIGKLDQNGNQIWLKDYLSVADTVAWYDVVENNDGTFATYGEHYHGGSGDLRVYFLKADSLGNVLLQQRLPMNFEGQVLFPDKTFTATADGGYALACWLTSDPNHYTAGIIKMDSLGRVFPHLLTGKVFLDMNNNCAIDGLEPSLTNSVLTFTNATDTFAIASVDSGHYAVGLNSGPYNLQIAPSAHYTVASSCMPTQISVLGVDSIINLGVTPTILHPYVNVDGATRQRECFPVADYKAQYCNNGTAPFTGTINITLDSLDIVDSASRPWTTQTGNSYQFRIDTLGLTQCASVSIYYHITCDPDLLGRTLCIDADVYSDTVINPSPLWDRSNLVMTVRCNLATDSVEFRLKNTGTGGTNVDPQMIVIEDNVISIKHVPHLNAGDQYNYHVKANGSTWRTTVQQTPNNPYSSFTTAAIEGCGVNLAGTYSKGFITQYPNNGYYAYHTTTCKKVVNSYDPNHKSVSPEGAGSDHLVDSTTDLEYTIEFQNTGNDTAYFVKVIDTLASYLDISSIKPGISSHPYQMELGDNRSVTFTFYNILLPDSGHNLVGSNGFVKFKIKQVRNNQIGTVINNDAAIYFDYNAPVITNTATVKIGTVLVMGIENLYTEKQVLINAYPNPFNTQTVIKVEGENFDQLDLIVYDVTGKIIKHQSGENINQFTLTRQGFSSGSYLFELTSHGKMVSRGKLLVD